MTFSPLADMSRCIPDVGRSSERLSSVTGFIIHHNAGVDAFGQATAVGREVGANYWILNDGTILPHVDEDRRAFTSGWSGSPDGTLADHRSITVEVSNTPEGVANGTWTISRAAQEALSRLIGDVFSRYGLGPVTRDTHTGVAVHRDFVPTECPGPYIMGILGPIITDAEGYRKGSPSDPTTESWEDTLKSFSGKSTRKKEQIISGGNGLQYVKHKDEGTPATGMGGRSIAHGPGYMVGVNVGLGLTGPEGARAVARLVREKSDGTGRVRLAESRATTDTIGRASLSLGWSGYLSSEEVLRVLLQPQAKKTITVEDFYWNGMYRPGSR